MYFDVILFFHLTQIFLMEFFLVSAYHGIIYLDQICYFVSRKYKYFLHSLENLMITIYGDIN